MPNLHTFCTSSATPTSRRQCSMIRCPFPLSYLLDPLTQIAALQELKAPREGSAIPFMPPHAHRLTQVLRSPRRCALLTQRCSLLIVSASSQVLSELVEIVQCSTDREAINVGIWMHETLSLLARWRVRLPPTALIGPSAGQNAPPRQSLESACVV